VTFNCTTTQYFFSCGRAHAADRGVAIRIYLDGTQLAECERAKVFISMTSPKRLASRLGSSTRPAIRYWPNSATRI
jgi:hypothetical protein